MFFTHLDFIFSPFSLSYYSRLFVWCFFQELLTRHKLLCAEFLEHNYDRVFSEYQGLLNSENYVTRRQSLKLLGELLLDRHNFTVMTRYISNPDNLKLMMNMLKEKSRNIQFEAFHVFKVPSGGLTLIVWTQKWGFSCKVQRRPPADIFLNESFPPKTPLRTPCSWPPWPWFSREKSLKIFEVS